MTNKYFGTLYQRFLYTAMITAFLGTY